MVEKYLEEAIAYYNIAKFQSDNMKKKQKLLEYKKYTTKTYDEKAKVAYKVTSDLYKENIVKSIQALNMGLGELYRKVKIALEDVFYVDKSNHSFSDKIIMDFYKVETELRACVSFYKKGRELLLAYFEDLRHPTDENGRPIELKKVEDTKKLIDPNDITGILYSRIIRFEKDNKEELNKLIQQYAGIYKSLVYGNNGLANGRESYKNNIVSGYDSKKPLCDIKGFFTLGYFYDKVRGLSDNVNIYNINIAPI